METPKFKPAGEARSSLPRAQAALQELEKFVGVVHLGFEYAVNLSKLESLLGEYLELSQEQLRERSQIEEYARSQRENNFSYLYELAVVRIWSILEACCEDLAIETISMDESIRNSDTLRKLKGPLLEFSELSSTEQARVLLQELRWEIKAPLQRGIGRFEVVLDAVGRGGPVDEIVRKVLFELSEIRNAIVHNNAKVDQRLAQNCSWLKVEIGQPISLSNNDFNRYITAVYWYIVELSVRSRELDDISLHDHRQTQEMLVSVLSNAQ